MDHACQMLIYSGALTHLNLELFFSYIAFEDCNEIIKLFEVLKLKVQIKDVYINPEFAKELEERAPGATIPQLFISFERIGGASEVITMNDSGQLRQRLQGFEKRSNVICADCGGVGYILCTW